MENVANSYMSTDSIAPDKTLVKWQISGHMIYTLNIMGLFMDKMIGGDLQTGLENLKKLKEKYLLNNLITTICKHNFL